jgi:hypothetical protein
MRKSVILSGMVISCFILGGCCDEDFAIPDYNFFEFAIDVTPLMVGEHCSDDAAFSTTGATGDMDAAECWFNLNNGPIHNRWFKFTANQNEYVTIEIRVGDPGDQFGTQRRTYLALWEDDGITELSCSFYDNEDGAVSIYYGGLTEGETYYFSVDVADSDATGTFTLCIYDTD